MYKRDLCICKPFQYIILFKFTESYIVKLFCCCCFCSFVLLIFPHNDLLFPISLLILICLVLVLIFLYYMRSLFFYFRMFSVFFHTSSIQIENLTQTYCMQHLQPYEKLTDECLHSLCLFLSWEQMTQWSTFNRNGIHSKPISFVSVQYIILEYN